MGCVRVQPHTALGVYGPTVYAIVVGPFAMRWMGRRMPLPIR